MEIIRNVIGILGNNTYILYSPAEKKGVAVDPAGNFPAVREALERAGVTPAAVLLTHGHFDHIYGLPEFLRNYPVPVYAAEKEIPLLGDMELNLTRAFHRPQTVVPDRAVRDGDILGFPGFSLRVMETPGHTAGSVCYYNEEDGVLISGDTLFENAWGRTDYPTGDSGVLADSVLNKLFRLPGETRVLPGHGNETTIAREKGRTL